MDTNYDEWSDFEINKKVASIVFNGSKNPKMTKAFPGAKEELGISSTVKATFDDDLIITVNFCKDPSDAWDIIIDNKITITHNEYDDMYMACSNYNHSWCHEAGDRIVFDNEIVSCDPLRAAMICFLKLTDVSND